MSLGYFDNIEILKLSYNGVDNTGDNWKKSPNNIMYKLPNGSLILIIDLSL